MLTSIYRSNHLLKKETGLHRNYIIIIYYRDIATTIKDFPPITSAMIYFRYLNFALVYQSKGIWQLHFLAFSDNSKI